MSKYAGFNTVELQRPKKSQFDLSHVKRATTRMGRLAPVFISEAVPSDRFRISSEILLRMAPLLAPIYDSIELYVHFFFVPNRLLWKDWETFITGGRLGAEASIENSPIPPYFDIGEFMGVNPDAFKKSSLADYLGVPVLGSLGTAEAYEGIHLDAMPFLAYQLIWFNYYRDRNFVPDDINGMDQFPVPSGEILQSDNLAACIELQTRAYEHEYFTSALPFTQRGEEVLMPLAGTGSVTYLDESIIKRAGGAVAAGLSLETGTPVTDGNKLAIDTLIGNNTKIENIDQVMLTASSVSINDFRTAYALQVWLERNAVAGSRYNESTYAHFAVKPQDERLQRPEYIGGGRIPIKISEVVSTAWSTDGEATVPLANMAGHGITYGNTNQASYFCFEHGFIIGICSIMNPPSYHQGLPKMFRRRSFLDYIWPTFAKLGEQRVDKAEIYASPANLTEDIDGNIPLFGYQSRYADWKFIPNTNHGDFHDTLLFWTLTRQFDASPTLGDNFVKFDSTTQDRIFAVPGSPEDPLDNFWLLINNRVTVTRPLPYFGSPNHLGFS